MTKHIVILAARPYGGSWGVGDTEAEAFKTAESQLRGMRIAETRHRTVEVAKGRKLVVEALADGIQWHTEPAGHFERSEDEIRWEPIGLPELRERLEGTYRDVEAVIDAMVADPTAKARTTAAWYRFVPAA